MTVQCPGCGAEVPDVAGPTHPYLVAAAGCWAGYGEWSTSGTTPAWHIDAYAAQHPDGAEHDRRQRQSVAVHLIALCLILDQDVPAERVGRLRGQLSRRVLPKLGLEDWPYLAAPHDRGALTFVDVAAGRCTAQEWGRVVWGVWSGHHDMVRRWAFHAWDRS